MTLNHLHLGTKNLKAFLEFYERYFGFKKKFDHGDGAFLVNESHFLIAVDPVKTLPDFPEWYHFGFCLDKEADVFQVYEKMRKGQVHIVRDMLAEEGSFASFFVKDPDGHKIEISWHAD